MQAHWSGYQSGLKSAVALLTPAAPANSCLLGFTFSHWTGPLQLVCAVAASWCGAQVTGRRVSACDVAGVCSSAPLQAFLFREANTVTAKPLTLSLHPQTQLVTLVSHDWGQGVFPAASRSSSTRLYIHEHKNKELRATSWFCTFNGAGRQHDPNWVDPGNIIPAKDPSSHYAFFVVLWGVNFSLWLLLFVSKGCFPL